MNFEQVIDIEAPPERVWPWIEDPERQKQWMTGWVSNQVVEGDGKSPGSVIEMEVKEGRQVVTYRGTMTTYDAPRELAMRLVGGCMNPDQEMDIRYQLTPTETGTRLAYSAAGEMKGVFVTLFGWLFKRIGARMMKKMFRTLKAGVEAEAAAA